MNWGLGGGCGGGWEGRRWHCVQLVGNVKRYIWGGRRGDCAAGFEVGRYIWGERWPWGAAGMVWG